ncbi:hypothetical protein JW968_01170 [Candidatus Woesearchaeota archaeon]|nr:hypothetical protein [Candidatus Woesearchaeota archaeon]
MKKCIICEEEEAVYCIKGMPNQCYCEECAKEQFSDLGILEKLDYKTASKTVDEVPLPEEEEDHDG